MFSRLLTVCTGNICRSPLAAALLRSRLTDKGLAAEVQSAGIGALVGHPADASTQRIAIEQGIALDVHRAQQIDTPLTRWADLIVVMEQHHLDEVLALDPTARGKTFLLGHWLGISISDPFQRDEAVHRAVGQQISDAVDSWLKRL
ncbi:low molecular weight phosphotyrosine protein phosphatase [Thauera sp. UPWRP]|nr:low molecular weight phosphotyrosine protein phosphatase [Thauera sp. UPWRP]